MPFAANGDVSLHFDSIGDVDAPAVLLLAGAGRQSIDFSLAFCNAIAERGFRVIRYDQRDTGFSTGFAHVPPDATGVAMAVAAGQEPTLAYAVDALAEDARAVLDAAGAPKAHLFGRSLGALTAQVLAIRHPNRIVSATLVMAFSRSIGNEISGERLAQMDKDSFDAVSFADRQVAIARAVGNPDYFDEARIRADAAQAFARGHPAGSIARHFMVGLAAPDLRPDLAGLRLPVQVIQGARDRIIPLHMGAETAAAIPGARYVVFDDMAHEGPPQLWTRWIDLFAANAARDLSDGT